MGRPKGSKNKKTKLSDKPIDKSAVSSRIFCDSRYKIGKYIIDKFLDKRYLNSHRDYTTAFKLVEKFNSLQFWKNLPCEFKVKNLSTLLGDAALKKLEMFWNIYQKKLNRDKKIKVKKLKESPRELKSISVQPAADKKVGYMKFCK